MKVFCNDPNVTRCNQVNRGWGLSHPTTNPVHQDALISLFFEGYGGIMYAVMNSCITNLIETRRRLPNCLGRRGLPGPVFIRIWASVGIAMGTNSSKSKGALSSQSHSPRDNAEIASGEKVSEQQRLSQSTRLPALDLAVAHLLQALLSCVSLLMLVLALILFTYVSQIRWRNRENWETLIADS